MIFKVYDKWNSSPVIVSFAEKTTPVWDIPFPAITICPVTKAMSRHVNFTKGFQYYDSISNESLTSQELRNLEAVAQICDAHLFSDIQINSGLQADEIVPMLRNITMSLAQTTLLCNWGNSGVNCTKIFTEILTEEGFCYTFNILKASELFRQEM